jgi:GNAT superfamily N-acetyltransferase
VSEHLRARPATPEDRETIADLWRELMDFHRDLDPEAFDLARDARERWLDAFDGWMVDEDCCVLVADASDELVGFIIGHIGERRAVYQERSEGLIGDTYVAESWRRRGVGRLLVAHLTQWFRRREVSQICVGLAAANPVSNAFWRALGFRPHLIRMLRPVEPEQP